MKKFFTFKSIKHWLKTTRARKTLSQQTVDYLYTPIIAIILFMVAMFTILWSLSKQESDQAEIIFYREVAYAEQSLLLNFEQNEEELLLFSKNTPLAADPKLNKEFFLNSSNFLNKHPEVVLMQTIPNDPKKILSYPSNQDEDWNNDSRVAEKLNQSLKLTLREARISSRGTYSSFIELQPTTNNPLFSKERSLVFWYVQPSNAFMDQSQSIAILYSVPLMMNKIIPKDILARHHFSILNNDGQVLYTRSDRNLNRRHSTHQIKLAKFADNLILQGESYPLPSNLSFQMLFWLVIGLCSYVIWSFWSLWKQMKLRQDIQRNLMQETGFRRAIEDSMPIGLRVHELDGSIRYVNPAFCKLVGWSAEELIGLTPPFPFWAHEDEKANSMKLESAFKNNFGPPSGIEAILTNRNGKKIFVRNFVSPMMDAKDKQTGWIASLIDISEPRRVRDELAISQQRFITVLEGLTAGISVVNPKTGELLYFNNLYQEMFGDSSEAHLLLLGKEAFSADNLDLDLDNVDGFAGLPSSALTPIIGDSREVQIPEKSEWYEVRRRYIPWTDGHLAQMLITTNITERHLAQENLRLQEERLQFSSRLTTMGEMASSIAHELNQPLAAINNYCMGLMNRLRAKKDAQIDAEIIPAIEKVSAQALRAGTIIQRIRNFVKRSAPQRQSCFVEQIIHQSLELAEIEAHRQGLQIETSITSDLPECFVDPILIEQVIVNLIKNAIDSMKDTYPRSRRGKAPPIQVIADLDHSLQNPMLRIRIIDRGKGIAPEIAAQIFDPFFSTKEEGMGMGLNICRSIIESHEGRLIAENNTDLMFDDQLQNADDFSLAVGCTFTILLPFENYLTPLKKPRETSDPR
jgi:PAS domain S-box-containing protein